MDGFPGIFSLNKIILMNLGMHRGGHGDESDLFDMLNGGGMPFMGGGGGLFSQMFGGGGARRGPRKGY